MSDPDGWCQNAESGEEDVQPEVIVVQVDVSE